MRDNKGHRKYADRFPYTTPKGVQKLLRQAHVLADIRFERADFAACDILIDLKTAIERAGLTQEEQDVIIGYLINDEKSHKVAQALDTTSFEVTKIARTACRKIAAVYTEWDYDERGGELDAGGTE